MPDAGLAKPTRLAVVQPALAKYRVPVFRELANRPNVDLRVWHGAVPGLSNAAADGFDATFAPQRTLRLGGQSLSWHAAMREAVGWADVAFLLWDVHYLPSLIPAIRRARRRGCGTVLWGHGYGKSEGPRRRALRNRLGRAADAVLVYGQDPARWLVGRDGFDPRRVFVAQNTIDATPVLAAAERWRADPDALRRRAAEFGLTDKTLLHVSRSFPGRRTDLLLDAAARLADRHPTLRVALVGAGHESGDPRVLTPGPVYDEADLAPYFLSSAALVFPAEIGLGLHHAMAYGLPAVTHDDRPAHAPEVEALRDGETGLLFRAGDAGDLAAVLDRLLSDDALRRRLGDNAAAAMRDEFTLSRMVDGFIRAARAACS